MIASRQSDSANRRCVVLSVSKKLDLIKKLESGVSVACLGDEDGVKKQSVSNIHRAKDKLRAYALKYSIDSSQSSYSVGARQHMKVATEKTLRKQFTNGTFRNVQQVLMFVGWSSVQLLIHKLSI
jgi:hypothetical protein